MDNIVEVKNVTKIYGKKNEKQTRVLKDIVDCQIKCNTFLGIVK